MAVQGYITHAARNRRFTLWLLLAYVLAFQFVGAFALTLPLLMFDYEHTILSDPFGYLARYALPLAAASGLIFWRLYRGHAATVIDHLHVRIVSRVEEPRFFEIAEKVFTTLGVRAPRFGVIDAPERNAVTVGEGPNSGLVAVTRGLLEHLDDDELSAVLAHEASHIRNGDTKLLAANHALMRTAVELQINNPLRIEDWRQMIIPLIFPPMLLIMLASSAATMISMHLARIARRGLKLSRDHIADGEAVRTTHCPEALISALRKVSGQGAFVGSYRVAGALFDGPADHEGGSHPTADDRVRAISTLGEGLMDPQRQRRDTRSSLRPQFRRSGASAGAEPGYDRNGRPLEQPPTPTLRLMSLYFTDREAYREWQRACTAWFEWRVSDKRNALGLTSKMIIPVATVTAFLLVFHWPADGDLSKLAAKFGPGAMVNIAGQTHSTFCSGPSYKDGNCPGGTKVQAPPQGVFANAPPSNLEPTTQLGNATRAATPSGAPPRFGGIVGITMMVFLILAVVRPKWIYWFFGVVREKDHPIVRRAPPPVDRASPNEPAEGGESYDRFDQAIKDRLEARDRSHQSTAPPKLTGFGRKGT